MEKIEKLLLKGVTRRFGSTIALHSFDLAIDSGQFVTLLGPSGCGKSTALNCLAGLLDLSEGEIVLNNKPIQYQPAEKRGFGMVFQNYALFPHLTAIRNISYGLEIRGVRKAEREQRVRRALEIVHLQDFGKRYPAQLSGGQQQRLAIARTLVLEPALLLLDEPLSNLDANLRNEMRVEIKRIHNELGLTTLYVTHDQSEAMSLSDVVVVMRLGRIEQIGTPQEIYNHPTNLFVARFMGYLNQLPVTLQGKDGDYWLVKTASGTSLKASSTTAESTSWQPGQSLIACMRPDETLADPLPVTNILHGQIKLVEYMGRAFEALTELADAPSSRLLVYCADEHPADSMLDFGIRPDRLLLFSNDETPSMPDASAQLIATEPAMQAER
jgi:putative spermidine/putrescine transport system ATP-binding protein